MCYGELDEERERGEKGLAWMDDFTLIITTMTDEKGGFPHLP